VTFLCGLEAGGSGRKARQEESDDDNEDRHMFCSHQGKKGVRCCLKACPDGESGGRWMQVNEKTNAGARDWSRHIGRTFCKACFMFFANHGSFAGRVSSDCAGGAGGRGDALAAGGGAEGDKQDGERRGAGGDDDDDNEMPVGVQEMDMSDLDSSDDDDGEPSVRTCRRICCMCAQERRAGGLCEGKRVWDLGRGSREGE
jgi:hypothetical protein